MSFFDSLTAISLLLGVVAAPSESIKPLAVGNQGTCMAQGFIQHVSLKVVCLRGRVGAGRPIFHGGAPRVLFVAPLSFYENHNTSHHCCFESHTAYHVLQIGSMGSPLYTLSLAFFYLLTIKYDMKEETFRLKYEYYLHIIPNVFIWASAIYLLSDGYFNDAGYGCWIASYPDDCGNDSEVPCIRG